MGLYGMLSEQIAQLPVAKLRRVLVRMAREKPQALQVPTPVFPHLPDSLTAAAILSCMLHSPSSGTRGDAKKLNSR